MKQKKLLVIPNNFFEIKDVFPVEERLEQKHIVQITHHQNVNTPEMLD